MKDKIILKGMEFYGRHGVAPEEKSLGQKFIIDMELYKPLAEAGKSDSLDKTINYADVYRIVKDIAEGPPYDLIESVAEKIAEEVMEKFPLESLVVRVKKPQAPIPGSFEYVGVEIVRGN